MSDPWIERRSGWIPRPEDARSPWDVDYARIIHSFSFRRLQGKTQILNLGDSDFYRTRLTHSLEVGQIAAGLVRQLKKDIPETNPAYSYLPDATMMQAVGFTHDLGHPPFGHGGEVALNYCMRSSGGFEGNAQTLRILSRLETMSTDCGSDFTRRALLAVLKYPVEYSKVCSSQLRPSLNSQASTIKIIDRSNSTPPKCYHKEEQEIVDWILSPLNSLDREEFVSFELVDGKHAKSKHKSFDCSIMDLADDIAYGIHDMEDAISLRLVTESQFRDDVPEEKCSSFLESLKKNYPKEFGNNVYEILVKNLFREDGQKKRYISRLVHHLITSVQIETMENLKEPLLRFRASMPKEQLILLKALKDFVFNKVIRSAGVQHLEFKGQKMVVSVFEAFESDPAAFLPDYAFKNYKESGGNTRIICDHVAGMTDAFLLKTYDRLFSPRMGSVFDRL